MDVDALIEDIAARVREVAGLEAIVLGGSRVRGTHRPGSDVDLCFYCDPLQALDIAI